MVEVQVVCALRALCCAVASRDGPGGRMTGGDGSDDDSIPPLPAEFGTYLLCRPLFLPGHLRRSWLRSCEWIVLAFCVCV